MNEANRSGDQPLRLIAALPWGVICGDMAVKVNPQTAALNPAAIIAARQNRTRFVPKVDSFLVVLLPGESIRCPVRRVFDEDTVIVEIDRPPISKMHTFAMNDHVGVRRKLDNQGREIWQAQRDREFLAEQRQLTEMARPPAPEPPPPPAPQVKTAPPVKAPVKAKASAKAPAKAPVKAPVRAKAKAPAKAPAKSKAKTKAKTPIKRKAARR
jgi:hypothetical protein